jgi:hypothetical protein
MSEHQRVTLLTAILGSALTTIDGSIVNVALPAIEADLGGGLSAQQGNPADSRPRFPAHARARVIER